MEPAPLFEDVADAPEGGRAVWRTAPDGVRLRLAVWPRPDAKGTVLIFPGRTEYIEKYGPAAAEMAARGYAALTVDWRGQGLADRFLPDRATGHVWRFSDYQTDVAEAAALAEETGLPRPWFLIGHSMGGCIGLRALHRGLPVRAAAFSAPMWGIRIAALKRPFAWAVGFASRPLGFGHRYTPSTSAETYVREAPFEDNMLTTDPAMFAFMQRQLAAHPELALGGPSLHWLYEALREMRALARLPSPPVPALTMIGGRERIVDVRAVARRMERWPDARFEIVAGAEHEIVMERPEHRARFYDAAAALFAAAG